MKSLIKLWLKSNSRRCEHVYSKPALLKSRSVKMLLALSLAMMLGNANAGGIGYIDARRVIDEAPQSRAELDKLENAFAERKSKLQGQFDELKVEETDLEKNGLVMAAKELGNKTKALQKKRVELQRAQREYNDDYTKRRNQGLNKLEKIITEVTIDIAKKKKLDVVLQQVIYANPKIDLTDQVLKELEKRHEK